MPLQSPGAPLGRSRRGGVQRCRVVARRRRPAPIRREAVNAALSAALGTRLPLAVYAATRPVQDPAYAWIAVNRHRFRGVTPHCTARPGDCVSR